VRAWQKTTGVCGFVKNRFRTQEKGSHGHAQFPLFNDGICHRALDAWNSACSARDLKRVMAMIDDGPDVMVVGSDKGEVFKGRDQIEGWLKGLLAVRGFSWEMDRVDIDANGATAWAFVEGRMVVADTSGTVLGKQPYRFTSVMVKKGETWKWRVFDGAIIGGE
jgi:ketosteroid isomerase-like protein